MHCQRQVDGILYMPNLVQLQQLHTAVRAMGVDEGRLDTAYNGDGGEMNQIQLFNTAVFGIQHGHMTSEL